MQMLEFEMLCHDASVELGLQDVGALGHGIRVEFDGVPFEAAYREASGTLLLVAEIGPVTADCRVQVYENLLAAQLMTWHRPGLHFGFDPKRDAVVLCAHAQPGSHRCGEWLACVMRSIAQQAVGWRDTLLAGQIPSGFGGTLDADVNHKKAFLDITEGL